MALLIILLIVMVASLLFGSIRKRHLESLDSKEIDVYFNRIRRTRVVLLVTISLLFVLEIVLLATLDNTAFTTVDRLGHYGSMISLPCLWLAIYWLIKKNDKEKK